MKDKMLAAVFESEGNLMLREVDVPRIEKPDDVIIKVDAVGICGTDLHILEVPPKYEARKGTILGHEISGHVVKTGDGAKNIKVGDKVIVDCNEPCGHCQYCKMNLANMCPNLIAFGVNFNGAFAQYTKTSEKVIHKINESVSSDIATLVEPVADVLNGTRKLFLQPWENVLVLGGGPIGLLFGKMAKLNGVNKLFLSEQSSARREFAGNYCADIVIDPLKEDLEKIVFNETIIGADIIIDTVGSLLSEGIKLLRKGGKILLFGCNTEHIAGVKQIDLVLNEIQIMGSFIANCYFPQAVKLVESGRMDLEKLITHKFSLEKIHEGIELLRKGIALKVIIEP